MRNALGLGFDSRQVHVTLIKGGCMASKRELTEDQRKDVDEMASNFEQTLGSNDPEESDEDFFRGW